MHSWLALLLQIGLIAGPILAFLGFRSLTGSLPARLLGALLLAVASGWLAAWCAENWGWQPRGKAGRVIETSPLALFWIFGIGLLIVFLIMSFGKKTGPPPQSGGWRVTHTGRDQMLYEERANGRWRSLVIDGEMLLGPAHHVIYFRSESEWTRYPDWTQGRRDEIIARIKSRFQPPDYEYHGA